MPAPADTVDTVAAEKVSSEKTPPPTDDSHTSSQPDQMTSKTGDKEITDSPELYENPFLKPPKRIRLRLLNN